MNGGWPLSRQKLAAKSSDVTPIPGIGSLCDNGAFFDRPSPVKAPPIAAPKSAPTAPRTVRVAQSSLAAESNQRADGDDPDEDELSHDRHLFKADLTATEFGQLVQIEMRRRNQ